MILSLKVIGLVKESDKRSKKYDLGLTPQGQCHTECLREPREGVLSWRTSLKTSRGTKDH